MRVLKWFGVWIFGLQALIGVSMALSDGPRTKGGWLVALGFGALAIACWLSLRRPRRHAQRIGREVAEFFMAANQRREFVPVQPASLLSRADEPFLLVDQARMREVQSERVAGAAGTRIKVGNVPVYLGGSRARSVRVMRDAAIGELGLTARALRFHAPELALELPLSKVMAVDVMLDALTLSIQGRSKPVTFLVPNGLLWGQMVKNLARLEVLGVSLPPGAQLQLL